MRRDVGFFNEGDDIEGGIGFLDLFNCVLEDLKGIALSLKSGGDADAEGDAFVLEIIEIGDITDERIVFESDAITAILVGGERIVLMLFD